MLDSFHSRRLDDRDLYLLGLVKSFNESDTLFTFEDMAAMSNQCVRTVSYRMRRLQKKGLVKTKRIPGTRNYEHRLTFLDETTRYTLPQKLRDLMALREEGKSYLQSHKINSKKKELGEKLESTLYLRQKSIGLKPSRSLEAKYSIRSNSNMGARAPVVVEEHDMGASGPNDELLSVITSALDESEKAHASVCEKREKRRKEVAETVGRELYVAAPTKKKLAHDEKEIEDYTTKDLEIVYREQWREAGYSGEAFKWSGKERGQMHNFMREQPVADIVQYIKYVFSNWDKILRRYPVRGLPTIAAIYGFRKSWFAECFNGEHGKFGRGVNTLLPYNPETAKKYPRFDLATLEVKNPSFNEEAAKKYLAEHPQVKVDLSKVPMPVYEPEPEREHVIRKPLSEPKQPWKKKPVVVSSEVLDGVEIKSVKKKPMETVDVEDLDDLLQSVPEYGFDANPDIVGSDTEDTTNSNTALRDRSEQCRKQK